MINLSYPLAALSLVWGTHAGPVGLPPAHQPLRIAVGRDTGTALTASPMPRLTIELLTQLQTLEQALHHLPKTVQDAAKASMDTVTPDLNVPGLPPLGDSALQLAVVNWGTVAIHSSPVAAAFTQAHLSPHDYLPVLTAVISAGLGMQLLGALNHVDLADTSIAIVADTATVLAKNVEFAHRHRALIRIVRKSNAEYETEVIPPGTPTGQGTPANGTTINLDSL